MDHDGCNVVVFQFIYIYLLFAAAVGDGVVMIFGISAAL